MFWKDEINKERKRDRVLLLCGFGTSDEKEMEATYGRLLEAAGRRHKEDAVYLALTSGKVIRRLKEKSGILLPDVKTALEKAAKEGAKEIRILPVQVTGGTEYEKLKALSETFGKEGIRTSLGRPLLEGDGAQSLAQILTEENAPEEGEAILYAGHGSHGRDPGAPAACRWLQDLIREKGGKNIYVGDLQTGLNSLMQEFAMASLHRIRIRPLMMVSGHHWNKDVAGEDPDSWKNVLALAGYEVICEKGGLLEKDQVIDLLLS